MLLIYAPSHSPRLAYIVETLFYGAGIEHELTSNLPRFNEYEGARLQYDHGETTAGALQIVPTGILSETDIRQQSPKVFSWRGYPAFFETGKGEIPFDLFAASFYLLTRYEEYLPYKKDPYGRFAHENSIAFNTGFLKQPLVNLWISELKQLLVQRFPSLHFSPKPFCFVPTYDVDIAWRYKCKGFLRNAFAFIRSLLAREFRQISVQAGVLFGLKRDPFDIFKWLNHLHSRHRLTARYFVLLAQTQKGYDKNIPPGKPAFRKLLFNLAGENPVGLHPSWQSGDQQNLLAEEKEALSNIIGKPVTSSRQHYIRMIMPDTYRALLAEGITSDYSMGYGSINGFRASYCLPFYWYDLERNECTPLQLFPFCWMEANSYFEQHYSLAEAGEELNHYCTITRSVNGELITICHNHLLGNDKLFGGWAQMYADCIARHFGGNENT